MDIISCIVIVGKPGAGKSSIGMLLAKLLGGTYMSLGGFMRETLGIPDPHIGVDKNRIYNLLHEHLVNSGVSGALVLDCHPYPEDDLEALHTFVRKPAIKLRTVIHVVADDSVALKRLERRPRPGQTDEERLKYFNDHLPFIDRLLKHPSAMRIENNAENTHAIESIARDVVSRLST